MIYKPERGSAAAAYRLFDRDDAFLTYLSVYAEPTEMEKSAMKYLTMLKAPLLLKKTVMKTMLRIKNALRPQYRP